MNKLVSLIFVVFFIMSASCTGFYNLHSNSHRGQLSSMMLQVKSHHASPNTVAGVMKALRKMLSKVVKAQAKHRKVAAKMAKQCFGEAAFRKTEKADAKNAIDRSNAARAKCQHSLNDSNALLPNLQATVSTYKHQLKCATDVRNKQHAAYLVQRADYRQSIAFMVDFIKYVMDKFNKQGIKGFKTSFEEVSETILKNSSKFGKLAEAAPVLVELALVTAHHHNNYSYTPATETADKLKDALKNLLKVLRHDLSEVERSEAERLAKFLAFKALIEKSLETLEKQIHHVKEQVEKMKACIHLETKIFVTATAKWARNDRLEKSAAAMCAKFVGEFIRATKNRLAEIKSVKQVLKICRKRFGQLPKNLIKYMNKVKNEFIEYENSTEFHKFIAYKQKHTKDNKHGHALEGKNAKAEQNKHQHGILTTKVTA